MISLTTSKHTELLIAGLLAITSIQINASTENAPERVQDKLFRSSTPLLGRHVTCDNVSDGVYKFPSQTWSCYNIRVDGVRIQNQLFRSADVKTPFDCPDDEQGRNDLGALCRYLLKAHDIDRDLWAALVVRHPTCGNGNEGRVTFQAAYHEEEEDNEFVDYDENEGDFRGKRHVRRVSREADQRDESDSKSETETEEGEQFYWVNFTRGRGYVQTLRCMVTQL